jgi:hypothetical protein
MMRALRHGLAAIGIGALIFTLDGYATTRYVDLNCTNAYSPFLDWTTAATNIQDAIDASADTDLILVTNGVYAVGGRIISGNLTNRVALNKALTVQSVNGPFATAIVGAGATNGTSAVRCAWLTNGASLVGFTLQAGATRNSTDTNLGCGGGVWCSSSNAIVDNCLIVSNTAYYYGGGAYQGTLNNCLVSSNGLALNGSGAAHNCFLNSCTVVSNASYGVSWVGPYNQSKLTNCIVYYNGGVNNNGCLLSYSCTTPLASGAGNFTNAPQLFVDGHLTSTSPCRAAGTNLVTGTDLFGQPWLNPPSVGCAEWQPAPLVSQPQLQLTSGPVGFTVRVSGVAGQPPLTTFWIKGGIPLQDDGHFSSTQTTNLVATGVSFADAGAYQLVVTNAFGAVTSAVVQLVVHCVDAAGVNPTAPYSTWTTAAMNIQDAIDTSSDGDLILVTNGVYAGGGRVMAGDLTNRVALNKALTVQSVNGPFATFIQGAGGTNGNSGVRCAWLTNRASLVGFTLQAGATRSSTASTLGCGGGVWCSSSNAIVSNCLIVSNTGYYSGGIAYQGTLNNCLVSGNAVTYNGTSPAAFGNNLINCTVISNASAGVSLANLTNCIVYYNAGGNWSGSSVSYCCTTPLPFGAGNFNNAPQFFLDGHLGSTSPCRGAGTNLVAGTDIFGQPWLNPPSVGCVEWQPAPMVTQPGLQLTNNPIGFTINVSGLAGQLPLASFWIKDGVPLQDDGHYSSTQTTNLIVTGIRFADAGAYQLVVTNAFGSVTSAVARLVVHCVDAAGVNPVAPYSTWATAATNIQDAIDVASAGEVVVVTNGLYTTGGKAMAGNLTNRLALTKPVVVQSVNGPFATTIQGARDPGTGGNGPLAVRCAWLTNGAALSGFTLQNGATQPDSGYVGSPLNSGGGVWCSSTNGVVANCVLTNNSGVYGGGMSFGTLNNSLVVDNLASYGGGAYSAGLNNCTVLFNNTTTPAPHCGAGTYNGTTRNSIVLNNYGKWLGISEDNYSAMTGSALYSYCCTTTNWSIAGTGNISADPQLLDLFHIAATSPCCGAGSPLYSTGSDLDGEPWSNPPSIGCDGVVLSNLVGALSVTLTGPTNLIASDSHVIRYWGFRGNIMGRASRVEWSFGDGPVVTSAGYWITHQWTNNGNYTVSITAYNADNPGGVAANLQVHVQPPLPPLLQSTVIVSNAFQLQFMGQAGAVYYIQFATNLAPSAYWQTLQTINSSVDGVCRISDFGATSNATRFYRVQAQ